MIARIYVFIIAICFMAQGVALYGHSSYHLLKKKMGDTTRISIAFNQTDIHDILSFFADEYNLNIIAGNEIQGAVSFTFDNIHPAKAFDSILNSLKFQWNYDKGVLYIDKTNSYHMIQLFYADVDDVFGSVAGMVSQMGELSKDSPRNALIIRAPREEINRVKRLIKEIDQPPMQVLIKAKVLEVSSDDKYTVGTDLLFNEGQSDSAQNTGFSNPPGTESSGFFAQVLSDQLKIELEALETKSDVEVIAQPRIVAMNKKEASIITGERLGFRVTTTTGTTAQETVEFLEVGTKLVFTPTVAKNGDIMLKVSPEVSEGSIVDGLPQETTTEASTEIMVKDNQTVVIGGLVRKKEINTNTGIPYLVNLPFIGRLFGKVVTQVQDRELVILITPTIMTYKK